MAGKRMIMLHGRAYGLKLSKQLLDEKKIEFCINPYSYREVLDADNGLIELGYDFCMRADYEKIVDFNEIPALSKELMEDMLPYESMCLKLGMRETGFPIAEYEEQKIMYHKHLRFWNYVIEKYNINSLYIDEVPHYQYTYIIYALAQVKKIPTLIVTDTSIENIAIYGNSIETLGESIKDSYYKGDNDRNILEGVSDKVDIFVSSKIKSEETRTYKRNQYEFVKKAYYGRQYSWKYTKFYNWCSALIKHHSLSWYVQRKEICERKKYLQKRTNVYKKYMAYTLEQYNSVSEYPDYSKPYIFFALQLTPEETTIPRAGVFAEQYTSIQLLARCAKKYGIMIYVKEHYVQAQRMKPVYEIISKIDNVRMINSNVSSKELTQNAIASATHTGTVILESALYGKPVLVFGDGYMWKGIPNLFNITDENSGIEIIGNIVNGYDVNIDEVLKYFEAIKCSSIISCRLDGNHMWKGNETEEFFASVNQRKQLIEKYLL